jgi:vacuolar protein sorting-associated protein 54
MKSAIKTAVAELLPVLAARGSESEFFSGDRAIEADGEIFFIITVDVWQ